MVIITETFDIQKQLLDVQITDFETQLTDLSRVTTGNTQSLQTRQVQQEVLPFEKNLPSLSTIEKQSLF